MAINVARRFDVDGLRMHPSLLLVSLVFAGIGNS